MRHAVHALLCGLFVCWSSLASAQSPATRPRPVASVIAELDAGQSDAVTERLVLELGALRSDLGLDALRRAMRHRVASIRIASLRALGHFSGRADVAQEVALGLRDSLPQVRAAAADALASMNARTEVDTLLVAFDRGVPEAAIAIGTLGDDDSLSSFNRFLGTKPISLMLAGYQAWLTRDDVRLDTKLAIVATLENVAGLTVKRFLQSLLQGDSLGGSVELRRATSATVARIPEAANNGTRAP